MTSSNDRDKKLTKELPHLLFTRGNNKWHRSIISLLAARSGMLRETYYITWLLLCCPVLLAQQPANPNASTAARSVLKFLIQLRANNKVLLGQSLGHGTAIVAGYSEYVSSLYTQTGKRIGFIGGDYGLDRNINWSQTSQVFVNHAKDGGIVTISWHLDNPWTGGDSWDTNRQENLWELITPGTTVYKKWQAQKMDIANALRPLRDAGVPVLWRPLHEMNGDWFWWCQKNWKGHEDAYIALWRDMFNYLTNEQKLNNLLWVYSTATTYDRLLKNYYPGIDYVDVVGIDVYDDNVQTAFTQRDYNDLISLGNHPLGITEFGPTIASAKGGYDYRRLLNNMASSWPDAVFSYSWHDWPGTSISYVANKFAAQTFSRSDVVMIDGIRLENNPPPPTSRPPTSPPSAQIKPPSTVATANPEATNAARGVLSFLFQLQKNKQILLGQDLGHGSDIVSGFDKYVTGLNAKVGKWIGMIGGDYGLDPNHNVAQTNSIFTEYYKKGAIVTLSWTMDNPWTGGNAWDTNKEENLWELLTPGNSAYTNWEAQKLAVATALRPLRDAGVVVLWRPLHEMNGDWFWWCQKTWAGHEEAYIAVWQDLFNYLTYNKGMNNLLWVYSTANSWSQLLKNYYPGKNYVDIVGIDIYDDNVETWFSKRDYDDLKSLGTHPVGLTEFGPTLSSANGGYNYQRLINTMVSKWSDFAFAYSWHDWVEGNREVKVSFATNQGIANVFSLTNVITLDKMDLKNVGSQTKPPTPAPTKARPAPSSPPSTTKPPQQTKPPTPAPTKSRPAQSSPPTRKPLQTKPPTPAPTTENNTVGTVYRIRNRWKGTYLTQNTAEIGAPLTLLPLNQQWWSQRWALDPVDRLQFPKQYRLRNLWDSKFTAYANNSEDVNNAAVVVHDLVESWWSMRWEVEKVESNIYRLRNSWTGRYLTVGSNDASSPEQGTEAQTYDSQPSWWSQQWVLEVVS